MCSKEVKIYFITDSYDPVLQEKVKGNLINTTCGNGYDFASVGCKLNQELHVMLKKDAKWSCHFDDDNYVNVPILKQILYNFNPNTPYYLGRTATNEPSARNGRMFWFAVGGAGFCISNAALQIIKPSILKDEVYEDFAKHDNMPDDMAVGYMMDVHHIKMTEM
uniref:Fringe n=1 Tax=Panagrolaimus sp. PS1159 TaxID=55785 RepID=A0AC35GUT2_9BILA